MSQGTKTEGPQRKESGGFFRRLFERVEHETTGTDAHSGSTAKSTLDLGDIQGFILRGYRMPMVRHFLLTVSAPAAARKLLGRFVSGDESDSPQITTAEDWHVGFAPGPGDDPADPPRRKPDYCLNVGITWPGLIALEIKDRVPAVSFKSFGAFTAGAAEWAKLVGDAGPSAPENWIGSFGKGSDHVLVTLHALSPDAMKNYSDRLSALFAEGGAFREIWHVDGLAWTEMQDGKLTFCSKVPFGYTALFKVLTASNPARAFRSLPFKDKLRVLRTFVLVQFQLHQTIKPYQHLRYGSDVPFRHGPVDVVKYSATPSPENPAEPLQRSNPNGLQDELIRHVQEDTKMSSFNFGVQFLDAGSMTYWGKHRDANFWIENASIDWNEADAPFHTIARLTLQPKSHLQPDAADAIYFDVTGNSTHDSTPLGSINRARWPSEVASRKARLGAETSGERKSLNVMSTHG